MREPAEVLAPGELLREEFAARRWTGEYVGRRLSLSAGELQGLLGARRPRDEALAGKLAELLGTSADLWLQLERAYRRPAAMVDAGE